jgi:hypothetical protein
MDFARHIRGRMFAHCLPGILYMNSKLVNRELFPGCHTDPH